MLARNVGIVTILFSSLIAVATVATLVVLTQIKATGAYPNINAYLATTSVVFVLSLLIVAMGVLLVIPESRWKRTPPEPLLDQ